MSVIQGEEVQRDLCLVAAVSYLLPTVTDHEKKSLETREVDYRVWIDKCNAVAANHGMEFRLVKHSVKRPSGKLLLFGRLNHRAFDCTAGGDWSHCVAVDTTANYMACSNLDDPDPANHAAYGRTGWLSAYKYLSQTHVQCTYRLVKSNPTLPTRKRRQPDTGFVYQAETISARGTKRRANELFSTLLDKVCKTMAPGTVMYLEGDDGNTSSYISEAIKRRHTTLIVNFDPLVVRALAARNTGASLLASSVRSWSMRVMEASVVGCWLDYCSTLYGDASSSPFTDICNLVYRRAFRPGGIVAITLCTRDPKTCDTSADLPGKLVRMFQGNYPAAAVQDVYRYPGMMYCSVQL
jgi:hypothetical protein